MTLDLNILIILAGFAVIALASKEIGRFFAKINLPLISGFLFAGIIVGPFVLNLIPADAIQPLRFIDEISLAFIAYAAGSELFLKELRSRFKSIAWVTTGLVLATSFLGMFAFLLLADYIPFMREMSLTGRVAVAVLAGAILVARSPSSAIAIVNELRAKGPFTQTALGVTVIMDVVVIVLFAFNSEMAGALLANVPVNLGFVALLFAELFLSLALGYLLGRFLQIILGLRIRRHYKAVLLLLFGYSVFLASAAVRVYSHEHWPFEVLLEPLLIVMVSSFVITNWSPHRDQLIKILHDISPPIYVAFFTLTGASLALDVLAQTWMIAIALFLVRLLGIFLGSFSGSVISGESVKRSSLSWMAYVTQAGVGLGLAKEVAVEFPEFGSAFATIIISVIVLNQIVGPPLFKWVINRVGEAHPRGATREFDGVRDVIIFGVDDQAMAVARQLQAHHWQTKLACTDRQHVAELDSNGDIPVQIYPVYDLKEETLRQLEAERADAIVAMLSDDENYRVCELFYEQYGMETMVVRLNDRGNFDRFHELGALIVEPGTAVVSLLDQFVRSPTAASLILGSAPGQDIIDIEVCDPDLDGVPIRDLRLPADMLIMTVRRDDQTIMSHGYTRLRLHDKVTVVGSEESLDEVMLKFKG
ncbi:MAG: potassium transporter TrkA [Chloroflexi bacterium]|nr:potassium transporter TrkA [Chloroflexota bacterium]